MVHSSIEQTTWQSLYSSCLRRSNAIAAGGHARGVAGCPVPHLQQCMTCQVVCNKCRQQQHANAGCAAPPANRNGSSCRQVRRRQPTMPSVASRLVAFRKQNQHRDLLASFPGLLRTNLHADLLRGPLCRVKQVGTRPLARSAARGWLRRSKRKNYRRSERPAAVSQACQQSAAPPAAAAVLTGGTQPCRRSAPHTARWLPRLRR